MDGVRCAALALQKADWLVAVLSAQRAVLAAFRCVVVVAAVDFVTRVKYRVDVVRKI